MSKGHNLEWEKQEEAAKIYERDRGKAWALSRIQPLYSPSADKSKSFSLSPPFCCFCWEICPLSGYHALSEHLPPSGPIFRKQMGSEAIPLPLQTAESGTLRAHLHTVALPETSHPWQGAHSVHTSHWRSKPCLIYLLYLSYMSQCFLSLSLSGLREDGWLSAMPSSTEGADLPYLILPLRV